MNDIDGLLNIANWIDLYILGGAALSLSVIFAIGFNKNSVKIFDLEFPLKHFVCVLGGLTLIHLFLTWMFVQKVEGLDPLIKKNGTGAWGNLINSSSFIFNNMKPRVWVHDGGIFGNGGYEAFVTDTAFWASFIFSILLVVATYFSLGLFQLDKKRTAFDHFTRFALGCFLASCNWVIGSQWAIAASALAK